MKEAAGVCGGRGQVMEKVRECVLKLSRDERCRSKRRPPREAGYVVSGCRFWERAVMAGMENLRVLVNRHTSAQACKCTSKGWDGNTATTSRRSCSMKSSRRVEWRSVS